MYQQLFFVQAVQARLFQKREKVRSKSFAGKAGNKADNRGDGDVSLKLQKRLSQRHLLHVRSENLMVLTCLRLAAQVFRAKIRSQYAVWMHSAEVDVLFRVRSNENYFF